MHQYIGQLFKLGGIVDHAWIRRCVFIGLMSLATAACSSRAGVPEFRIYKEAFDASQVASAAILDELAIVERAIAVEEFDAGEYLIAPPDDSAVQERRDLAESVASRGFDPVFYIEDAAWISDFGDPPYTASYRRALGIVADFNNVALAYAEGRALDELKAEAAVLGAQAQQLLGLIGGLQSAGSLAPPGVGTVVNAIAEAADLALQAASREAFRAAIVEQQPLIDRILEEVQSRTPTMFTLITARYQETATRASDEDARAAAIKTIETYRSIFANWVVLLGDARVALREAVAALDRPSGELALLRDLNASAVDLQIRSETIQALLLKLRQPG